MSPRTGRPKAEKPLSVGIKARIDVETNERLMKYCKENGTTRTEVIRKGIEMVLNEKKKQCKPPLDQKEQFTLYQQTENSI